MAPKIMSLCEALKAGGETAWADLLQDEYHANLGMDALRCSLSVLRRLRDHTDVADRLGISGEVASLMAVLEMAVGVVRLTSVPRVSPETLRDLLSGLT